MYHAAPHYASVPVSCYFLPLRNIFLSILLLNTLSICSYNLNETHLVPYIYKLQLRLFQNISPSMRSCVTLYYMLIFYCEELLAPHSTPKLTTTYLIYSQLPSKFTGHLLHPQSVDVPCRGDRDPTHPNFMLSNTTS
jgi:hypothetical protein